MIADGCTCLLRVLETVESPREDPKGLDALDPGANFK